LEFFLERAMLAQGDLEYSDPNVINGSVFAIFLAPQKVISGRIRSQLEKTPFPFKFIGVLSLKIEEQMALYEHGIHPLIGHQEGLSRIIISYETQNGMVGILLLCRTDDVVSALFSVWQILINDHQIKLFGWI